MLNQIRNINILYIGTRVIASRSNLISFFVSRDTLSTIRFRFVGRFKIYKHFTGVARSKVSFQRKSIYILSSDFVN